MNIEKARKILEKSGKKYSDEEITFILSKLRELAVIQIQIENSKKEKS